jgi:hypothetical protein
MLPCQHREMDRSQLALGKIKGKGHTHHPMPFVIRSVRDTIS